MSCFHFGWHTMSRPQLRQAPLFGRNTQSCPHSYRIDDSKQLRHVSSEMIRGSSIFLKPSHNSRVSSKSTMIFVCRIIPIVRNARSRNRWPNGPESRKPLQGLQSYKVQLGASCWNLCDYVIFLTI